MLSSSGGNGCASILGGGGFNCGSGEALDFVVGEAANAGTGLGVTGVTCCFGCIGVCCFGFVAATNGGGICTLVPVPVDVVCLLGVDVDLLCVPVGGVATPTSCVAIGSVPVLAVDVGSITLASPVSSNCCRRSLHNFECRCPWPQTPRILQAGQPGVMPNASLNVRFSDVIFPSLTEKSRFTAPP